MADTESVPAHVAGYTIMGGKALRFGIFGRDYLGHSQEGLRLLKVLREGEGLVVSDDDYAAQREDASLLTFDAGQQVGADQRVLTHHTVQATSFGVLVGGSPLQNEAIETTREFDEEQRCATALRGTTLVQKVQLARQVADVLAALHERGRQHPYLTPWNVLFEGDRPRLAEVGLGYKPDDPRFDRDRIPEDVLVFLAPEVLRAIRDGSLVQASPAADVYALGATIRAFLHNRVPDPAGAGDAPRREQILRGQGIEQRAHEHYSRDLDALLARALSLDPNKRPSAKELGLGLQRLVDEQRLEWKPVPTWPKYAAIGVVAVAALLGAFLFTRPDAEEVQAKLAFADATRIADPDLRARRLDEAATTDASTNTRQLLPEARRLKAIDAWIAWQKDPKDPPGATRGQRLEQVLQGLEQNVIAGHDDALSRATRVLVGLLRRWELGGAAREAGDAQLDLPARDGDSLAVLAAAVKAMTAAGPVVPPKEEDLSRWLEAAAAATQESGPFQRKYALHDPTQYSRDVVPEEPEGISLQAGWIGHLVAGVIQTRRGLSEDARTKLDAAHRALPGFATKAALGLALAEAANTRETVDQARALLDEALLVRDFAEGRLALGRLVLQGAHKGGTAEEYRKALQYLQAATGSTPPESGGPELLARAQVLEAEALFYEATTLAVNPDKVEEARQRLDVLLDLCEKDPARFERFLPDAHVARGLVLVRQGQADKAVDDLLYMFQEKDVTRGPAELPQLEPPPPTRQDPSRTVGPLYTALLARVEALAQNPKREDLPALEEGLAQVRALAASTKGLDQVRLLLAEVQAALGRARVLPDGRGVDEALTQAEALAREALNQAGDSERWLDALEAKLEVYKVMAGRAAAGAGIGKALEPLTKALDELAGMENAVPRAIRSLWRGFSREQLDGLRAAYVAKIDEYSKDRQADWDAIDVVNPGYDESRASEEAEVLERAIKLFGDDVPAAQAFKVAQMRWRAMQLYRARRLNPKVYEHGEQAARLLETLNLDEVPQAGPLAEKVHYLLGWIALREGESLKNALRDPRGYGLDELARAAGARDFADLRARIKAGNWQPKQEPARAIVDDVVRTYDDEKVVPRDPKYGQEVRDARRIEQELQFATQMDPKNAGAFLTLARVQFSLGQDKLEGAVKSAETAYELAGAAGQDKLAILVQAARLYCYARFQQGGAKAAEDARFRAVAEKGARAAEDLFRREAQAAQASYHYGPAYWVARSHLEEGKALLRTNQGDKARPVFEKARQSYEEFKRLVEGHDVPAEAARWVDEYNNAIRTLETLRK